MKLNILRQKIDEIDKRIVKNLSDRLRISEKISRVKNKNKLPILDKKREEELISKLIRIGKKQKLNTQFIKTIYREIFRESRRKQKSI